MGASLLGGALLVLLLVIGTQAFGRASTDPPPVPTPSASASAQAPIAKGQAGAAFVGEETCVSCHSDKAEASDGYKNTPHGRRANPRAPAAAQGCESCHGPGGKHIDDPSVADSIKRFPQMAPRDVSATCVTCHNRSEHTWWQGSMHDTRNLSCVTCHSVHAPQSDHAQLKKAKVADLCATCHRTQAMKLQRAAHMPVREGKMDCATCHNPHGSANVKQLRVGMWVNETCVSCHTEKRGPFLFEHAAGREACSTCHDPHGSNNDRMLVARTPMLCQRCHVGTRHPSTIYSQSAFGAKNIRVIGRSCVSCHQQIHGSNHPAGNAFLR